MTKSDFCVFIISHGRSDNIKTIRTLEKHGYTGLIYIVIDDLDKTRDEYEKRFPDTLLVFNKVQVASRVDKGDNFNDLRTTTHARNACFDFAESLGIKYFLVLDDDYTMFRYRFDSKLRYKNMGIKSLDKVFRCLVEFLESTPTQCIALAQGGDFIGGDESPFAKVIKTKRKIMNTFFCSTDKRFNFISRLNEDVNTYLSLGSTGTIFLTTMQATVEQTQTQANAGGMTETYLESGTYVKSFYSVMYQPPFSVTDDRKDFPGRAIFPSVHLEPPKEDIYLIGIF